MTDGAPSSGPRHAPAAGLSRGQWATLGVVAVATAAAGVTRYTSGVSEILAFVVAGLSLAGLAWMVSFSTEQLGQRFGPGATGLMQSTLGNLPEFFVVIFALQAGERTVAETALVGSILVNALLVLGLVIIVGAWRERDGVMRFGTRLPLDTATLLLLSTFIIVLIGLTHTAADAASHHSQTISVVGAIALLVVYAAWLRQYLGSDSAAQEPSGARVPLAISVAFLLVAGGASAFVSDWFIHALQPTINSLHISQAFAGLVIVAIAGNAVENVTGIVLAHKGHSDLAISVVKNSVSQIAAFLYPLLVLVSLLTASRLSFMIPPVYIGGLLGMAIIVWQITGDGEATVFEGAALVATFVVLAAVALYE